MSLGQKIPVTVVNKILRFVDELHAVDAGERLEVFRSLYDASWSKIMEDIRGNTPRYIMKISRLSIPILSRAETNDIVPAVSFGTSALTIGTSPTNAGSANAGAGRATDDLDDDVLFLSTFSPDCNPKTPFTIHSRRLGSSFIQIRRKALAI